MTTPSFEEDKESNGILLCQLICFLLGQCERPVITLILSGIL